MLDPDVVLRADGDALLGASRVVRGAPAVAEQALVFARRSGSFAQRVLVDITPGSSRRSLDAPSAGTISQTETTHPNLGRAASIWL